jgi:hypothetical protein
MRVITDRAARGFAAVANLAKTAIGDPYQATEKSSESVLASTGGECLYSNGSPVGNRANLQAFGQPGRRQYRLHGPTTRVAPESVPHT